MTRQHLSQTLQVKEAGGMQVRDGMSGMVLTVGPGHSLREAARLMADRKVGAAVVLDPEQPGPGIVTERDILYSLGDGQDPDSERVADHLTSDLVFASPEWARRPPASPSLGQPLVVLER
jgi:CBS domain-containing protein